MKKICLALLVLSSLFVIFLFIGCSSSSSTTPTNNPPNAPTNLVASQTDRKFVLVNWTDASDNEDTFRVARSTNGTDFTTVLRNLTPNIATYRDSTVHANSQYWYRVTAINTNGSNLATSAAYWTWPAVFDFSAASHLDSFQVTNLDNVTHAWVLDAGRAKLTVNGDAPDKRTVSVLSRTPMPNQGWFEFKLWVHLWYRVGSDTTASYVACFVEKDPTVPTDHVVGLFCSQDSTVLGYYSGSDTLRRLATNPTLPLLTDADALHTIRFFHSGQNWTVYVDGTSVWNGPVPTAPNGAFGLYQEWQFDRGYGPTGQQFWLDDVSSGEGIPGPNFVNQGPLSIAAPRAKMK